MTAKRARPSRKPQPHPSPSKQPSAPVQTTSSFRRTAIIAAILVVAGTWSYSTSFRGVFVLDDIRAIVRNPTTTSFGSALTPPPACTVSGRPVANLSLALNYALAPADVRDVFVPKDNDARGGSEAAFLRNIYGYHLLNLVIHLAAGLLLYGCVRRTLETERLAGVFDGSAPWVAGAIALIWLVHPLQTESVTYVVQRVESLMALFYLLTLYCAIRASERVKSGSAPLDAARGALSDSRRTEVRMSESQSRNPTTGRPDGRTPGLLPPRFWSAAAVIACACGMGTKEAMVSAPLVVALWDWMFGSRERGTRWGLLAALAATWVILFALVLNEHRAPSLDVGPGMVPRYLFTQAAVILHYLRLSLVPSPLVFLYTWPIVPSLAAVAPQVLAVGALLLLTIVGVVRRVPLAFAGAWFFLILAPTSSILPIVTEVAAEHRMYLPLAAVIAVVVIAAFVAGRRALRAINDCATRMRVARLSAAISVFVTAVACATSTYSRNQDYWNDETLWKDTVEKQPDNQRARVLYGVALMGSRQAADAESQFQAAVALAPGDPIALGRLGGALAAQGKLDAAVASWQKAVSIAPDDLASHRYLGEVYAQRQDDRQALQHFDKVLAAEQDDPVLLMQVASILADSRDPSLRDPARATMLAERAAALTSRSNARVLEVLSVAQAGAGRYREAAGTVSEALQLARRQGNGPLASELEYRLAAYQARSGQ